MDEAELDRLRKLAGTDELADVQYLDAEGNPGARGELLKTVRLVFVGGEYVDVPAPEYGEIRRGMTFKMRKIPRDD